MSQPLLFFAIIVTLFAVNNCHQQSGSSIILPNQHVSSSLVKSHNILPSQLSAHKRSSRSLVSCPRRSFTITDIGGRVEDLSQIGENHAVLENKAECTECETDMIVDMLTGIAKVTMKCSIAGSYTESKICNTGGYEVGFFFH